MRSSVVERIPGGGRCDDDQCAFEINQRFGDARHVGSVVGGRFIEQRFGSAGQSAPAPGFLAAGETFASLPLLCRLPQTEAAEIVAQLLLQFLRRQTRHMQQDSSARRAQLVLGEVAELNTVLASRFTVATVPSSPASSDRVVAPLRPSRPIREAGHPSSTMDSRMMRYT